MAKRALGKTIAMRSTTSMSFFRYRLFGLTVASELELPELAVASDMADDVRIRVVDSLAGAADCFHVDNVATYRVPDGTTIEVAIEPGSLSGQVRLFLLGSATGMLLYRRGELPLHANALGVHEQAWAFFGPSGSGKSTLAAWMARQGHKLLADDVCVVRSEPNRPPVVAAGVPRLRLWEDAALREGLDPAGLQPSFPGDPDYRKFDVTLGNSHSAEALPLAMLCLLDVGAEWSVTPLIGAAAVEALFANSYRGEMLTALGDPERHWRTCVELARNVPMFRYCRTMDYNAIDRENAAAMERIGSFMMGDRR